MIKIRLPEPDLGLLLRIGMICIPIVCAATIVDVVVKTQISALAWGITTLIFSGSFIYSVLYDKLPVCYHCECLLLGKRHPLQYSMPFELKSRRCVLCEDCVRTKKNKIVDSLKPRAVYLFIDGQRCYPPTCGGEPQ